MSRQPADLDLLLDVARRFAAIVGAPCPDDARIRDVVRLVVEERGAIESAEMGLITKHEAALLLLAHIHSALFQLAPVEGDDSVLVDDVLRGLFGATVATAR